MCNKSRTLVLAALLALPLTSQALTVNLFINDAFKTVAKPNSGSVTVVFDGVVQVTGSPTSGSATIQFAYLNGSNTEFLNGGFSVAFIAAFNNLTTTPNQTYTGDLFEVTVDHTDALGLYNSNAFGPEAPSFIVSVADGVNTAEAVGTYAVEVVPEPATLALLALPALAALRRKKVKA